MVQLSKCKAVIESRDETKVLEWIQAPRAGSKKGRTTQNMQLELRHRWYNVEIVVKTDSFTQIKSNPSITIWVENLLKNRKF